MVGDTLLQVLRVQFSLLWFHLTDDELLFSCNRRRSLLDNVSCFLEKSFEAMSRISTPTPNVTLVWNSYFEGTCFQKVSTGST